MFAPLKPGPMSAVNCILRNVMEAGEGGGVGTWPGLLLENRGCVFLHSEKHGADLFLIEPQREMVESSRGLNRYNVLPIISEQFVATS